MPSAQDLCTNHINAAAQLGRALAALGTAPTENAIAISPIGRTLILFGRPTKTMRHAASLSPSTSFSLIIVSAYTRPADWLEIRAMASPQWGKCLAAIPRDAPQCRLSGRGLCAAKIPPPVRPAMCAYYAHHRPTFALPTPYLGRFMFGFRLKAKPEHEAAQVGRW